MEQELQKLLTETEQEHQKLVLLQAGILEKINLYKEENKKLVHLLTVSKGKIDGYQECLKIVTKNKE